MKVDQTTIERLAAALKQLRIETLPGKKMGLVGFFKRYELPYVTAIPTILVKDKYMRYEYVNGTSRIYYWLVGETNIHTAEAILQKCYNKTKLKTIPTVVNNKEKQMDNLIHIPTDFLMFWNAYPKKVGKDAALKQWKIKKSKPDIHYIIQKLTLQKQSYQWTKDNGQWIPNPITYINQGRWDDEVIDLKPPVNFKDESMNQAIMKSINTLNQQVSLLDVRIKSIEDLLTDYKLNECAITAAGKSIIRLEAINNDFNDGFIIIKDALEKLNLKIEDIKQTGVVWHYTKSPRKKLKIINPISFHWTNPFKITTK